MTAMAGEEVAIARSSKPGLCNRIYCCTKLTALESLHLGQIQFNCVTPEEATEADDLKP